MSFDFSAFRTQNAEQNSNLLKDMDIRPPSPSPAAVTPKKARAAKAKPSPRTEDRPKRSLRASTRVRDKALALTEKKEKKEHGELREFEVEEEDGFAPNRLGKRIFNPKRYGSIPNVLVNTTFPSRMAASTAAVHAPTVAGISPGPLGCWSICVSGGYEGDRDDGTVLTFSGAGGRNLKGTATKRENRRTAPQSSDQTWDTPLNAALVRSVESKKPIRVLRGFKGKSRYAPVEGYIYSGLYQATKTWLDVGKTGFKICRARLERLPGQPPLPVFEERTSAMVDAEEVESSSAPSAGESLSPSDASDSPSASPQLSPEPEPSRKRKAQLEASTIPAKRRSRRTRA
ncbi:hypothetical protein JCM1841_002480 [Sporobolomyces salmonicolor]